MSTPPIKPPISPVQRWLSNDNGPSTSKKSSEDIYHDHLESTPPIAISRRSSRDANSHQMSYAFDENLFYSAPSQALLDTNTDVTQENTAPVGQDVSAPVSAEASVASIPHPPDFTPFFTLISDSRSRTHHHPTVHYIFNDDDPEILTNAALTSLEAGRQQTAPGKGAEERYVIVDIAPDGKTVAAASSLSSGWQGIQTSVAQAPSWGEEGGSEGGGLMLTITGQQSGRRSQDRDERQDGSIDELMAAFNSKLESLDGVLVRPLEQEGREGVVE